VRGIPNPVLEMVSNRRDATFIVSTFEPTGASSSYSSFSSSESSSFFFYKILSMLKSLVKQENVNINICKLSLLITLSAVFLLLDLNLFTMYEL